MSNHQARASLNGTKIDRKLVKRLLSDFNMLKITNEELNGIEGNLELSINEKPFIKLKRQPNKEYIAEISIPTIKFNDKKIAEGICFIDVDAPTSGTICTTNAFILAMYVDAIQCLYEVRLEYLNTSKKITLALHEMKLSKELNLTEKDGWTSTESLVELE